MKRLLAYLIVVISLGLTFNVSANAAFDIKANQIILINSNTNQVLYEKNSDQKINPAGFTKIMTSIIVFDLLAKNSISLDDKVTISEKAWRMSQAGYSSMFIMVNDEITIENLLRGIIVASGNDACVALAEGIAGTEENFVSLMNEKAQEIGFRLRCA
jgi:D-alanyl-D-alanine carboxypeptidase (penicillin-binding protein 5/6)